MRCLALIGPQPSATWHWFVAFFGTALLLLPATVAMGATLPAMERVFASTSARNISISALYAANTAGAVVGVIAAAFWLVPQLGLAHSALACAVLNFVCAAVALSLQTRRCRADAGVSDREASRQPSSHVSYCSARRACSASATKSWSFARSVRSRRTRSTRLLCCSPST